ncbi:hypothetical protein [Sporolactobacillus laevolacticus]|uniref:Uncharacterized protein n=1 Tax=Sporolactobacillus laevolacticus DSM 442 TaxID=1395513 RepID=V6IZ47_9BACL|nr:hypothetical protein [Sporolactobacillus laevolacticus]EST12752.1 hypothetical protein P343_05655 [Sporolactobacillus laevolacticus DSM 442]
MFFYITAVVFGIALLCLLIGYIQLLRYNFESSLLHLILNKRNIKLLSKNEVSPENFNKITLLVMTEVAVVGMLFALFLFPEIVGLNDDRHLLVFAIAAVRYCFDYLITKILKKDAAIKA